MIRPVAGGRYIRDPNTGDLRPAGEPLVLATGEVPPPPDAPDAPPETPPATPPAPPSEPGRGKKRS